MKVLLYKRSDTDGNGQEIMKQLKELPEGQYILKVVKHRPVRSLSANAFYHMRWSIVATHTGHYVDEIKREFYDHIGYFTWHEDKRGKRTKRYKSSADEDTAGMGALINQQGVWISDEFPEVIIPRKEDATYLQYLQVETEYTKVFSGY